MWLKGRGVSVCVGRERRSWGVAENWEAGDVTELARGSGGEVGVANMVGSWNCREKWPIGNFLWPGNFKERGYLVSHFKNCVSLQGKTAPWFWTSRKSAAHLYVVCDQSGGDQRRTESHAWAGAGDEGREQVQEVRHSETVSPAGRTWSYSDTETGSRWKFTEI